MLYRNIRYPLTARVGGAVKKEEKIKGGFGFKNNV